MLWWDNSFKSESDLLLDEPKPQMRLYSSDRHFLLAQANIIGICIGLLKCQPADMQITNPLIRGSER